MLRKIWNYLRKISRKSEVSVKEIRAWEKYEKSILARIRNVARKWPRRHLSFFGKMSDVIVQPVSYFLRLVVKFLSIIKFEQKIRFCFSWSGKNWIRNSVLPYEALQVQCRRSNRVGANLSTRLDNRCTTKMVEAVSKKWSPAIDTDF